MKFNDHFSGLSQVYRAYRPSYPDEVFAYLREHRPEAVTAWDCACGSGQATEGLARVFPKVIATDASAEQIANAPPLENVTYRNVPAEKTNIGAASVDVTVVAQAVHWFDIEAFYREVRRVTNTPGLLALITYGLFSISDTIDPAVQEFYGNVLDGYWPQERAHVDSGYATLEFPFQNKTVKTFTMTAGWDLPRLMGFFATWSAVTNFRKRTGRDPLPQLESALAPHWGPRNEKKIISWPLTVIHGGVGS